MMLVDHPLWDSHGKARLQELRPDAAAFGTTEERARTADALLKDADALHLLSTVFRTQANQLAPVSRLSPEALLHIFHILVDENSPRSGSLGWVGATHVCRSWRNLLLNEHTIWANNAGIIPRAITAFLERSGSDVPLHLHMGHGLFARVLLDVPVRTLPLHRVHTWRQAIWNQDQADTLHEVFCKGLLPNLQELTTNVPKYVDHSINFLTSNRIPHGNALSLVSWTSKRVFLNIIAPALTHLTLSVTVHATTLLTFLSNSPLLERLTCVHLGLDTDNDFVHPIPRVPLHLLCEFQLLQNDGGPNLSVYDLYRKFLVHIDHPRSTDVTIITMERLRSTSDLELLRFYMQSTPQSAPWRVNLSPTTISFHATSSTSPTLCGARNIELRFNSMETLLSILRERSQSISIQFGRIDQLSIFEYIHPDTTRWSGGQGVAELAEFYGVLNNTHSVHILCSGARSTSGALALNHLIGTEYPFPALRHLRLGPGLVYGVQMFPSTREIIAWLEPRVRARAGPSTLRLEYMRGQNRRVAVDPELIALIPDTRYVESEDPNWDHHWRWVTEIEEEEEEMMMR